MFTLLKRISRNDFCRFRPFASASPTCRNLSSAGSGLHADLRSSGEEIAQRSPKFRLITISRENLALFSTFVQSRRCWQCETEVLYDSSMVCSKCGVIQPLPAGDEQNYFRILGMMPNFDVNTVDLTKEFRNLQSRSHPDKYAGKSQREQEFSAEWSSFLNAAYQTILDPLSRGHYLLRLVNEVVEETGDLKMDDEFLIEIMEKNELLASEISIKDLEVVKTENEAIIKSLTEELSIKFREKDWKTAKILLAKLQYYVNIENKIKALQLEHNIISLN